MRLKLFLLFTIISGVVAAQSTANFDSYANASNLTGQGNWLVADGPNDGIRVYNPTGSAGSLYSNSTGDNATYYSGTFSDDQYAQCVYTAETADAWMGVAVRASSASGGSYYGWVSDSYGSYFVEMNNGTPVPNTYPPYPITGASWVVGDVIKLEVEGTTIRFYRNGALDVTMSGDGILTDASIASGNPGVAGYGLSTSTRIDDWEGGDIGCPSMTGGVIADDQSISSGEDVDAFTSTSSASGGTGTITYTWFKSTTTSVPDTTTWTKIEGEVATTLDYGTLTATTYFFRKATAATCGTAYSNVLTVSVASYGGSTAVSTLKVFPLNVIRGDQISHDQRYILDGACADNDSVGRIYYNCTDSVFYDGDEDYQMTILTDASGGFKITGQTLAVSDHTKLSESTLYSVTVQVADTAGTNRYDTITCLVYVLNTDSTIYVDPSGADGSGTKASPHNHINGLTLNPGYTILIKRGETVDMTTYYTIENTGNPTKYKRIGAYGTGVRPILSGTMNNVYYRGLLIGAYWAFDGTDVSLRTKKVELYDLDMVGFTDIYTDPITLDETGCNPIQTSPACQEINIYRVKITGASDNACFYFQRQSATYNHFDSDIIIQDCEANDNTISGHGFKFETGGVTATNIWGSGNTAGHFLDLAIWNANNKAYYVYGDNEGTRAVVIRHPKATLQYFVIKGEGGIEVTQPTEIQFHPDSTMISDGYMISNYYSGIAFITDASSGDIQSRVDTVQRFVYRYDDTYDAGTATTAAIYFGTRNTNSVVRQCVAYGTANTGVFVYNSNVTNLKIHHNAFYDLTYYGVLITSIGTGGKVYNNTGYNNTSYDFSISTTNNVDFRNNSYQDRAGVYWSPSSSNYVFSTGDPYTDSSADNYYPTAEGGLVDVGADLSLTEDIVGTAVPQGDTPDIGAYEYLFPSPEQPTEIPSVKHRVIIISL